MNKILTPEERIKYTTIVRKTKNVDEKVRLCAVLAYDLGHDPCDIAEILQISETTAYKYVNDYLTKHKTSHDPKGGSFCKLTELEEVELIAHLHEVTYLYAKEICAYVLNKYEIKYTVAGITKWLERNEFVHKQPKVVPGKLDTDKQIEFVEYYRQLKSGVGSNDVMMFMDAVHPEYQSQAMCGWIPKGVTKTIATTNKQFRLHLNGAICLDSMDVFIREYETINAEAIICFLKDLEAKHLNKTIHIICDNGRANKNQLLQEYLKYSRVKIHYLPPYSPNLNAIERLWKIMRERVTYNKYYPVFADFKDKVHEFFDSTIHEIIEILKSRVNDKFQIIHHNPVRLSS